MHKIAAIACLLTFSLWADQAQEVQSFITYEEWKEIADSDQDKQDCIVLINGTRIAAALTKLPSLTYNFVKMDFDVNEIKTIAVVNQPNEIKLQYITREGQNYIGKLAQGKFVVWVTDPLTKDPAHMIEKEIDPKLVNFIVLGNRNTTPKHTNPYLSSLELKNGYHIPITIMTNPIFLTNGWSERKIKAQNVLELSFDEGVYGKLLENGAIVKLGFMYVKESHVMIQIPRNKFIVKLPWSQISHIQGYNGGFRQLNINPELLHAVHHDEPVQYEIGNLLIGYNNEQPDCLGIEKGYLLIGAICSNAVAPKAIAEVQGLGLETAIAMDALFDSDEDPMVLDNEFDILEDLTESQELKWLKNITFEQEETHTDILWGKRTDNKDAPLSQEEKAFIEEFLTGRPAKPSNS